MKANHPSEETVIEQLSVHTDIAGRVRNTRLPTNKSLWPLFEAISNSIHSIEEQSQGKGKVEIRLIRQGNAETYRDMEVVDIYPITGMEIVDNGVGFDQKNFKSFLTSDSDYKLDKGAKGIGRFVCLKAFKTVSVDSIYAEDGVKYHRRFDFRPEGSGVFNYENKRHEGNRTGTKVTLLGFRDEYQKKCPTGQMEISQKIVEHFLVYFLMGNIPSIRLVEQNSHVVDINRIYEQEIKPGIRKGKFDVEGIGFVVHLVKIYLDKAKHEIHYCANERDVVTASLGPLITDLGRKVEDEEGNPFVYLCRPKKSLRFLNRSYDTFTGSEKSCNGFTSIRLFP